MSVSIDFPVNSKKDASSHCATCDYSFVDLEGLCYHLETFHGRVSLDSASAATNEFGEF